MCDSCSGHSTMMQLWWCSPWWWLWSLCNLWWRPLVQLMHIMIAWSFDDPDDVWMIWWSWLWSHDVLLCPWWRHWCDLLEMVMVEPMLGAPCWCDIDVMSFACLIEDPLPLSSPFIPLLYLALRHPLFPLLLHSFTSSNLALAPSTLAHPFLNLTLSLLH